MRVARAVILNSEQRRQLEQLSRARSLPARQVERARIVLRAADGWRDKDIASELGITPEKAARWRNRFLKGGLDALQKDAPRPGRPHTVSPDKVQEIVHKTTQEKPTAATHWSTRTMAVAVGVSAATVRRIWQSNGLKPHLSRTFKVSKDPHFAEKLEAVVGLYLNPPEHALVFCVDEKSQIQALDRTQPGLPMKPGRCGTMTHDYKRNGTTTLFAALNVGTGEVVGACMSRHRHDEFLAFLRGLDRRVPAELDLHVIVDNYATHKHATVRGWLERHPRVHLHFTPTSSSWLNQVERFFAEITDKAIRRGVFRSVRELEQAITAFLAHRNQHPRPYTWTASVEAIMEKVERSQTALKAAPEPNTTSAPLH